MSEIKRIIQDINRRGPTDKPLVILFRGIPGSGKSTAIRSITGSIDSKWTKCSADDFRTDPETGQYRFEADKNKDAHQACLRSFIHAVTRDPVPLIFVDNTNVTQAEIQPYASISEAYGCDFLVVECIIDPQISARRNCHFVPRDVVFRMHQKIFSEQLPTWWRRRILLEDDLTL